MRGIKTARLSIPVWLFLTAFLTAGNATGRDEATGPGPSEARGRTPEKDAEKARAPAPLVGERLQLHRPKRTPLRLLTAYLVEGEVGLMGPNLPRHALRTQRRAHLRVLAWGDWFLDTLYEEELLFTFAADQVNHTFDYIRVGRYLWGPLAAYFFWNHTCNNIIFGRGVNHIHWNDLGIEVTTDPAPGADRIQPFHFRIRGGWAFLLSQCEYRWMFSACARFRIPSMTSASPFAGILLDTVGDPERVTVCPVIEVGVTIPLGPMLAVEPFARLIRRRDAMGYLEDTDSWFMVGMRLVQQVDARTGRGPAWEPRGTARLAFRAGYAARLFQKEIGYLSDVSLRLMIPEAIPRGEAFFEVYNGINTPPEDMFPNFMTFTLGPTVARSLGPFRWEASYRYRERRAAGSHWFGRRFKCVHVFSLRAEPDRLPEADGIHPFPERFRWGAWVSTFPFARNFPFKAEVGSEVRVFCFPLNPLLFFFRCEGRTFFGPDNLSVVGVSAEFSMVWPGTAGDFRLFLRFDHAIDPFRTGRGDHAF
ncbi:MAG: hypothetical protein ACYTHN_03520, partial [Planctomycetota bacterium]